jgi:hypothetical protein
MSRFVAMLLCGVGGSTKDDQATQSENITHRICSDQSPLMVKRTALPSQINGVSRSTRADYRSLRADRPKLSSRNAGNVIGLSQSRGGGWSFGHALCGAYARGDGKVQIAYRFASVLLICVTT